MKIAILGMGGIGGVVGAALAKNHDGIYFIARGETLKAIKENGLKLNSDLLGSYFVSPELATENPDDIGPVDALIVSTKSYGLDAALRQCENIITEETIVLPLLNGISVSDDCERILNKKAEYAEGSIFIFSNIVKPGEIVHVGKMCRIVFGFKDGRKTKKAEKLADMLTSSGINTQLSDNIMVTAWEKYIMMCGNSCVLSFFECNAGEVRSSPERYAFIKEVYSELAEIARAKGIKIPEDIVEKNMGAFNYLPDNATTSLYRDLKENKEHTEFESIIGKAARMADETGVPAPCVKKAYAKYKGR